MEEEMEIQRKSSDNQKNINQQVRRKSNGLGVAGFVLSLLGLFLVSYPIMNVMLLLGFICSFCGMFESPNDLVIAGFCMSLVGLVIIIA